jgi:hypothetical protein
MALILQCHNCTAVWCPGALHHVTWHFLHPDHTAWSPAQPQHSTMHYDTTHYSLQSIGPLLITMRTPGQNPFISLYPTFYIDSRLPCCPCSPSPPRKRRLYYIVNHVEAHLDPLHHYSHRTHHRVSISSTIEFGSLVFHRQTQVNILVV